jgi:AraC-like DNA-binding protein
MVSNRCKTAVVEELKKLGLHFIVVELGEIEIMEDLTAAQREQLSEGLQRTGLELMDDKRAVLVQKIVDMTTTLINADDPPKVNYSELLSEKLGYDYRYLSLLFTEIRGVTIQQFIINLKTNRVKELLAYAELSLADISFKLHYSSAAHLCHQFKKTTGLTISEFNKLRVRSVIAK